MNKLILKDHATGDFFESYSRKEMEKIIAKQVANGTDLEDLDLVIAKSVEIRQYPTFEYTYKIGVKVVKPYNTL